MLNKVAWCVVSFYLCPTEKRKRFGSAEELLDKQKQYYFKKNQTKKKLENFSKKSCQLKKSLYLCSPNQRERRSEGIEVKRGIKVTKKTLKFSFKTFGHYEIKFYFCTRKYGATLTERLLRYKAEEEKIIDIQYNNQVRKN